MSHIRLLPASGRLGMNKSSSHREPAVAGRPAVALKPLAAGLAIGLLAAIAAPVHAVTITNTYVGTLSNPLTTFGATPGNNPGEVARGNKYVIKTSFDTATMSAVTGASRMFQTRDFQSVSLGDMAGGVNTFELFIPSEGFGGVLTQTGQDHFAINATTAQTAEIHFFNPCNSAASCATAFRGFEFESNFIVANSPVTPAMGGDIIFELRDADVNFSGTDVTSQVVNILDGDPGFALQTIMANAGTVDVRSESNGTSGGQQNPGVFLSEAVDVVAEAGASPLQFSATTLSVSTDAGTEQVTDPVAPIVPGTLRAAPSSFDQQPRQADNDLGAGRGDKEDFLNFQWTVNGGGVAGNQDGTRLDRNVTTLTPGGSSFTNSGTRAVENVNITRSLAQSGLQTTTDTSSFDLLVTEDITGLSDTDSVAVSYANTLPAIANASHTVDASFDINFSINYDDADLAINGLLGIADFEVLSLEVLVDGIDQTSFFGGLLGTGGTSQLVSNADLISQFGLGTHSFKLNVSDRAIALAMATPVMSSFNFVVQQGGLPGAAPEPSSLMLLTIGLAGLGAGYRRRSRPSLSRDDTAAT